MIEIISSVIFLAGYILISLEQYTRINKTAIALITGVLLWLLTVTVGTADAATALGHSAKDIFELVIFLLSSMTLVEILSHYGFFDVLSRRLASLHLKDNSEFYIIALVTFIFSTFLNNLTTTIVMIEIASRFFRGTNLTKAAAMIVIAANAGGAFSPIGDVTTTMLWLSEKFTASQIIMSLILPALCAFLAGTLLIGRTVRTDTKDVQDGYQHIRRSEWIIINLCIASFFLPLLMTALHLPPYIGLLFGLGIVWLAVDALRIRRPDNSKLSVSIEKFFQKTDISSLYFFIGMLIAISALDHLGILRHVSLYLFGLESPPDRIISGNIGLGLISSVLDNVPLTAAARDIVRTDHWSLWTLLAFTTGVGGSIFVIGSVPGIMAMTILHDMSFNKYLRIATLPALLGFFLGIGVWYLQVKFITGI